METTKKLFNNILETIMYKTLIKDFGDLKIINTNLTLLLSEASNYGVNKKNLLCYDPDLDSIVLFTNRNNEITKDEIANILIKKDAYVKKLSPVLDEIVNSNKIHRFDKYMYNSKRKTLEEVVSNIYYDKAVFITRDLMSKTQNKPHDSYFYYEESYNSDDLRIQRQLASTIYDSIADYITKNLSNNEHDILALYKSLGTKAFTLFWTDENRKSALSYKLDLCDHVFEIYTPFGKLEVEFANRDKYDCEDDMLAFDTDTKRIIIFTNDVKHISVLELIELLRKKYDFIHELTHYIDEIMIGLNKTEYPNNVEGNIAYLNDRDERKAFLQSMISAFGCWLFRNRDYVEEEKLNDENYVLKLFEEHFLTNERQVVDDKTMTLFRKAYSNQTAKNKKEFQEQIIKSITKDHKDGTFTEETYVDYYTRLLRLNETL